MLKGKQKNTVEIYTIPGYHPRKGVISVAKHELKDPQVRQDLADLIHDAPDNMRDAIEKLLGRDADTQSIRVIKKP